MMLDQSLCFKTEEEIKNVEIIIITTTALSSKKGEIKLWKLKQQSNLNRKGEITVTNDRKN